MGNPFEQPNKIEDPNEAEAAAYAEKPFQDALHDPTYREQLTEEGKKALDWLASQEVEKAAAGYRKEKSEEDPRVQMVREKIYTLVDSRVEGFKTEEEGLMKKEAALLKKELAAIGRKLADELIGNPTISLKDKMDLAPQTTYFRGRSEIRQYGVGTLTDQSVDKELSPKDLIKAQLRDKSGAYSIVLLELLSGVGLNDVALKAIGRIDHLDEDEVFKRMLPMIEEIRVESSNLNLDNLDRIMEKKGFIWDAKAKHYLAL